MSTTHSSLGAARSHYRDGERFADRFIRRLKSWSTIQFKVGAAMYVSADQPLTVIRYTLGSDHPFVRYTDQRNVARFVHRALTIAPKCDPTNGDLAVFDGRTILMFRRFDEPLSLRAAESAADECAAYILTNRKPKGGTPC